MRFTFDKFGIPFDVIYKERSRRETSPDYDVVVMPTQILGRNRGVPGPGRDLCLRQERQVKFLGMYGSSEDITGGFAAEARRVQQFLNAGGT